VGRIKEWVINHKGATAAIATSVAGVVGAIIWGLLPEKEPPIKEEWIPPAKKNWYLESDD